MKKHVSKKDIDQAYEGLKDGSSAAALEILWGPAAKEEKGRDAYYIRKELTQSACLKVARTHLILDNELQQEGRNIEWHREAARFWLLMAQGKTVELSASLRAGSARIHGEAKVTLPPKSKETKNERG